jgi:hypothetical protein
VFRLVVRCPFLIYSSTFRNISAHERKAKGVGYVGVLPDGERFAEAVPVRVERIAAVNASIVLDDPDLAEHLQVMDGIGE